MFDEIRTDLSSYRNAMTNALRAWTSAHGADRAQRRAELHDAITFFRIERLIAPL